MHNRPLHYLKISLAAVLVILVSSLPGVEAAEQTQASNSVTSSVEQANGIKTITFQTHMGGIDVIVPDDMAAGDTISGAVVANPKANSAEDLAHYVDDIKGYVMELSNATPLAGRSSRSKNGTAPPANTLSKNVESAKLQNFAFKVPASGDHIQCALKDKAGSVLATQVVKIAPAAPEVSDKVGNIELPAKGESGQPLQIKGSFSGNYFNSHVVIGGHNCKLLATSPRQLVCLTPKTVTGRTKIECRTGGNKVTGKFNNQPATAASDLLEVSGGWSGTPGPINITQSGPFVTWDTGSIKYLGTVTNDKMDFDFHNYRYESRGKGHLEKINPPPGYTMYLEGYFQKTSVGNKPVNYPKHACHLFRQ